MLKEKKNEGISEKEWHRHLGGTAYFSTCFLLLAAHLLVCSPLRFLYLLRTSSWVSDREGFG